jgi:penicillin-binding protein 1B
LKLAPEIADDSENSYFLSLMNDELQSSLGESAHQSRTVVSTLDPQLQRAAEAAIHSGMEAVDRQLRGTGAPAGGNAARPQVALIALDPHTGEIKALVGGRSYGDSQLNHALASRQPGSAFKPFVYAAAIETALDGASRTFTPASLVSDQATAFSFGDQTYQPKDYGGNYQGDVTLRTALARNVFLKQKPSLAEVAVRLEHFSVNPVQIRDRFHRRQGWAGSGQQTALQRQRAGDDGGCFLRTAGSQVLLRGAIHAV